MRPTYRAVTVLAVAAATLTAGAASAASAVGAVGQPGKVAQAGKVTLHSTRVIYGPRAMVTGPDGALWYTNSIGNSIGRITTSGHVKSAFHAPSIRRPSGIAAGPDGALWTISYTGEIMRVTTAGQVTTFTGVGDNTYGMAAGPDGAMWFCNAVNSGSIGRITTTGQVTTYPATSARSPGSITAGPGGAMWFGTGNGHVGRITTP
jgi:virginiamycin B lyase